MFLLFTTNQIAFAARFPVSAGIDSVGGIVAGVPETQRCKPCNKKNNSFRRSCGNHTERKLTVRDAFCEPRPLQKSESTIKLESEQSSHQNYKRKLLLSKLFLNKPLLEGGLHTRISDGQT